MDHNKLWKILKKMGIPESVSGETCMQIKKQVRTGHGTTDWFKLEKEYVKAVYCYPAYLTSMWSASCEMLDWMNHKLESRFLGEISTTSDM